MCENNKLAIIKDGKLNNNIINAVIGLIIFTLNILLVLKYLKINWCKCSLSAYETFDFLYIRLISENKFSKAGYHNIVAT